MGKKGADIEILMQLPNEFIFFYKKDKYIIARKG